MPQATFYPALKNLIKVDIIPEPIKSGINAITNKLFYKSYYSEKSIHGDIAYHHLIIVINSEVGLNLFGGEDGFKLLFNPGEIANTTEIPVALYYNVPILKYVKQFTTEQLSNPLDYFNVILSIIDISVDDLLYKAIHVFFGDNGQEYETFVQQFNTNPYYSSLPPLINYYNEPAGEVLYGIEWLTNQLKNRNINILDYIFENLVSVENNVSQSFDNLFLLFKEILGEIKFNDILDLFIPKFSVTIQQLELALAFPRTWLKPVDANGELKPGDVKSMLTYNVGSISYHSEKGFEFINPNSFSLTPSQIGDTGILIEIHNLKFDFRTDKNIPEATADGRPDSFKGVYVEYAAITLPKKWFNAEENHNQTTARIAGYNLLIGSGGFSGTIALETVAYINASGNIDDYYASHFSFNYPIQAKVDNTITEIVDYTALLNYLNTPENKNYQYIYPLSITKADNTELTFNNTIELHSYLNSLDNEGPKLIKKLGDDGFEIWFTSFDMTFKQGSVIESNIEGGLKIPRLKDSQGEVAEIVIKGHFDDNGGFNITASEQDGFEKIALPNILDIYILSLEVGRDSSHEPFYIGTSCEIQFTNQIMDKFLGGQRIKIDHMRIYSDGSFEIGAISIPTTFTINLGPVEITITGINFGSYQEEHAGVMRKYNYFGFDGAISLDPIGVDARGEGIKYYYTTDDGDGKPHHSFISIKTIGVDLTIPGNASASNATAIIKGWLSINEHEYAGGISLKLPKLDIAGGADMRLQPKPPAFIIDAYLDIPIAIPLAATGLGITGFRGLAGFRYVAEKEAVGLHSHDDSWYDYYTYPPNGVHVKKFNGPDKTEKYTNPVSLGAGVTITTMGSSDVISLRVMVLLSIPNMLLIDGRASILSEQWGLDDTGEPPFFAFLIVADNGIEIGAGLDLKIPQDTGDLIDLHVYMQAGYFWDNPSGWYLNMGTREDPITAKVLKLIEMESFLMLSSSGIEAGAKVVFDIDERFGPIRVKAWLKIEVGGFISFERPQIGGHLEVDAGARVDLFGIITVAASFYTFFSAEAAKPFLIYGTARVCGTIKLLFIKKTICATVEFKWERNRTIDTTPIAPIPQSTTESQTDMVKGIHMLTGETFNVIGFSGTPSVSDSKFEDAIIPLDTYIDIKFNKGLLPNAEVNSKIGGYNNAPEGYEDLIPPIRVSRSGRELRQVKHQYKITNIELFASDGGGWKAYDPYKAVDDNATANLKIGHWQKSSKEYNAIRILGNTPFSYTQQGEPGWFIPEQLGITAASLFCAAQEREPKCIDFNEKPVGTILWNEHGFTEHKTLYFNAIAKNGPSNYKMTVVDNANIFGSLHALSFPNTSNLEIILAEPSVKIDLELSSYAQEVKVTFYKSHLPEGFFLMEYVAVETILYPLENTDGLRYESEIPISKIIIAPTTTNQQEINNINEQIEQLYIDTYSYYNIHPNELPARGITKPINISEYNKLQTKLDIKALSKRSIYCQIYNELDNDGIDEYRFRIFNHKCEIVLSSSTKYYTKQDAINEMNFAINAILHNDNSIQIRTSRNRKWYFNILNEQGDVIARRIEYFNTIEICETEINLLKLLIDNNNILITENYCKITSLCDNMDVKLCALYDRLYSQFTNCFNIDLDVQFPKYYQNCYREFTDYIIQYGDKELIEALNPYFDEYIRIFNLFRSYKFCIEDPQKCLEYYLGLLKLAKIMLGIIYKLGNCNCDTDTIKTTLVHKICWLATGDAEYNINIPSQEAIQTDYQATVDAINKVVEPIWRPNTKYYMHFTLQDVVNGTETNFDYYYGFKTAGPIGHYHNAPNVVYGNQYDKNPPFELLNRKEDGTLKNPDEFALTSLNNYIDYKRSYPNANGDLLNSKPLFHGGEESEILLFFIKPYVYHMFKNIWSANNGLSVIDNQIQALKIFIKDPILDVIIPHPMTTEVKTIVPSAIETWNEDNSSQMPEHLQFLHNLAENNDNCVFTGGEPISPASFSTKVILSNLKPNKLYTAIITNTFGTKMVQSVEVPNTLEVHKFVFETSRYKNFNEQIMSFQLKDSNEEHKHDAVFNIEISVTNSAITEAFGIVENNTVTNSEFVDPLDAVIEGVLGINPLDPPVTTEFNFIKNGNTGDTIALWIRNPEPFNDPKIPLETIKETINILTDSNTNDSNYKMLFSKDYSQVLYMHTSFKITNALLKLKFKYLKWNGNAYEVAVDLDVIEINQINS